MRQYEDECVSCGLPCLGNNCPNRKVLRIYCDKCKDYADYSFDDEDLCADCLEKELNNELVNMPLTDKIAAYKVVYDCEIEDLIKW